MAGLYRWLSEVQHHLKEAACLAASMKDVRR
jgi:hypothetical protein